MRKSSLFLVVFMLLSAFSVKAEKVIGSYYNKYFDKTYEIESAALQNDEFKVYIQVNAEGKNTRAMIAVESENLDEFKKALSDMKSKYVEWMNVAKENNVTDMSKEMDIQFPSVTVCWLGSKWFFSFSQRLQPRFLILSDGRNVVTFVKKVTSSSNQYIDETIYWVFSNPEEIDGLLSQLDAEKIKSKLNESESKKDLFN